MAVSKKTSKGKGTAMIARGGRAQSTRQKPLEVPPTSTQDLLLSSDALERMSKEELIEYIRSQEEAGVRVTFAGKNVARRSHAGSSLEVARASRPCVSVRLRINRGTY